MSTTPAPNPPAPPPARSRRRRLLALALLAAAGAVGGWWWLRPRGPVPPAVPEAASGKVGEAIAAAREGVVSHPKSAAAWGHLGLVFTAHGYDDRAADCYREARRLDPADDRWAYMLGMCYQHESRDPTAAARHLEAALACRHPSAARQAAVRLRLAELYLSERRLPDAERLFREQLGRTPADPRTRLGLGVTLLAADRPREAVEFLTGATDDPSTGKQATTNLAAAARLLGDPDAAARYEREAARRPDDAVPPDPFMAEAAALRADKEDGYERVAELEKAGRFRDAIPILARMAEDPADVRAAVALGQNLSRAGDPEAAERVLRGACARAPENVKAALLFGTVLFDLADRETSDTDRKKRLYRESADACRRAADLKPDLALAHYCLGRAVQGLGDLAAAVPHFRRAVECRPEVPIFQLDLLRALVDAGLADEARTRLPAAERVVPADDPELARLRGRLRGATPKSSR